MPCTSQRPIFRGVGNHDLCRDDTPEKHRGNRSLLGV
jgi:hypothetical protein